MNTNNRNPKLYLIPIIISLIYIICATGYWGSAPWKKFLYLTLMILSFAGLLLNLIRGKDDIWNGKDITVSYVTGIMIIVYSRIALYGSYSEEYGLLGGLLSIFLIIALLVQFIRKAEIKAKRNKYYLLTIIVVCLIAAAYDTITLLS